MRMLGAPVSMLPYPCWLLLTRMVSWDLASLTGENGLLVLFNRQRFGDLLQTPVRGTGFVAGAIRRPGHSCGGHDLRFGRGFEHFLQSGAGLSTIARRSRCSRDWLVFSMSNIRKDIAPMEYRIRALCCWTQTVWCAASSPSQGIRSDPLLRRCCRPHQNWFRNSGIALFAAAVVLGRKMGVPSRFQG